MRFYRYLNVSFWYENKEYNLFPEDIYEDDFEVTVITKARHPDLKRGCIGNLIYLELLRRAYYHPFLNSS